MTSTTSVLLSTPETTAEREVCGLVDAFTAELKAEQAEHERLATAGPVTEADAGTLLHAVAGRKIEYTNV